MDPLTLLTIAKTGIGAVQGIYNWTAGESAANEFARKARRARSFSMEQLNYGIGQANKQIGEAFSQETVGMEARGISGPMSGMAPAANRKDRIDQLNVQSDFQRRSIEQNYTDAMDEVASMRAQNGMDLVMGLTGQAMDFLSTDYSQWSNSKGKAAVFNWGPQKNKGMSPMATGGKGAKQANPWRPSYYD